MIFISFCWLIHVAVYHSKERQTIPLERCITASLSRYFRDTNPLSRREFHFLEFSTAWWVMRPLLASDRCQGDENFVCPGPAFLYTLHKDTWHTRLTQLLPAIPAKPKNNWTLSSKRISLNPHSWHCLRWNPYLNKKRENDPSPSIHVALLVQLLQVPATLPCHGGWDLNQVHKSLVSCGCFCYF